MDRNGKIRTAEHLSSDNSILETATWNLAQSAKRLKLDTSLYHRLMEPKERIEITANPIFPDGRIVNFKAFIVIHRDTLGPAKGGIRMTPTVSIDEITGLAMEMTWKTSLIGVPFGGGKAGIRLDPCSLCEEEKEIVIRAFTRGAKRHIGPELYIPAPDMGTNEQDMGHISDCIVYSDGTSITKGCYVTGKPLILGGIFGRREATGKGVVYTILAACDKLGLDIRDLRIAIQGFGNVGSFTALEIARCGARVVAVADLSSCIVNYDGIDIEGLLRYVKKTKGVRDFECANTVDRDAIFENDCDIFIPAAASSQITINNVENIRARLIAEGANAPTTPKADEVLKQKGVFVIPDILCNAGGVFVSYLEYAQETQRQQMTLGQVEQRLRGRMTAVFNKVYEKAREEEITMRMAAMDMAVGRVAEASIARGFLP